MAKVTWGGTDLETAMNEWEPGEFQQYTGDRPPRGVYQWKVRLDKTTSANGYPQMIAHLTLEPHKAQHRQYKGYYCRDYIIVKEDGSTAFRVRPVLDALGVTPKQFRTLTQANKTDRTTESGAAIDEIYKIGPVSIEDVRVLAAIKPGKRNPDYEDVTWLSSTEAEEAGDTDAGDVDHDGDGDGEEKAPF